MVFVGVRGGSFGQGKGVVVFVGGKGGGAGVEGEEVVVLGRVRGWGVCWK